MSITNHYECIRYTVCGFDANTIAVICDEPVSLYLRLHIIEKVK